MSETTTTTTTAATKAGERAIKAVAAAAEAIPTVVETAEVAFEVPAKVVLNQKLIVTASIVGGAALGAGVLFGVNKFRAVRANKKLHAEVEQIVDADKNA